MQADLQLVQWVTDFGDQSVILPVSLVILLFFCLARWDRGAFVWTATIIGTLGTMLLLKLGIGACGWEVGLRRLNSPSGHTASATAVYGGLLVLLRPQTGIAAAVIAALLIAATFAASRLVLHDHTVPEVLIGAVVGVAGVSVFRFFARPVPNRIRRGWMLCMILLAMVIEHGNRLPAEQHVHSFAITELRARLCPGL